MPTDPKTIEGYNDAAEAYSAHVSNPEDSPFHTYYEKPAIRGELPDLHGLSVISIGSGSGADTAYLKEQGASHLVGIDISEKLIGVSKRNHPDIEFHVMDMENLDFPDESFDLAYSSLVFHYLPSWTKALGEARRVLKPGGKFIFSDGHPIESALEIVDDGKIQTKLLGRTLDKAADTWRIHGDYLAVTDNGVKKIKAHIAGFEVYFYHRPMSKIINDIADSGFTIEKMVEPLPTEGMKVKNQRHYDQLMKYPDFMIWVLRK
ncbi:MAG: class I SAM-dependent methyltransferase [Candidatus Vogelbacteria bacterium]|nr:class I SAM-dependent methyltransferase [Candidatus Vogelbacteria bacterium]